MDIGALGGSDVVCDMVVGLADVGALGSSDVALGGNDVIDDVAGSTSIGGAGTSMMVGWTRVDSSISTRARVDMSSSLNFKNG
uniref:Uncharacterized protein n=1 Tax=Romanomermis culicivorax TaxID=13658 RepID=A0A915KYI6_ROMCU